MKSKLNHPETVLSKVAHWYLVSLCDHSSVQQPWLRWLSTLWMTLYHIVSFGIAASIFKRSSLLSNIYGVVLCSTQLIHLLWWGNRVLFREVLQEVTDLTFHVQVPVESHIRQRLMTRCETRHKLLTCIYTGFGLLLLLAYFIPPIVVYLIDSSSDKVLCLPVGMPDPFLNDSRRRNGLTTGFLYLIAFFCFGSLNYVVYQNLLLHALLFDIIKTFYHVSGLAFLHSGNDTERQEDCVRSAIKYHQRVFRLSSKVKTLVEPIVALSVSAFYVYQAMCGLRALQFSSDIFVFIGTSLIILTLLFLEFAIPAETSYTARRVANSVYFNESWVGRRFRPAAFFPFIIMRANKRVSFRIYNVWILSLENYIQYLKTLYSFFGLLKLVTSRSQKESAALS